eukprot:7380756-Prymnesium_polylepis.1
MRRALALADPGSRSESSCQISSMRRDLALADPGNGRRPQSSVEFHKTACFALDGKFLYLYVRA